MNAFTEVGRIAVRELIDLYRERLFVVSGLSLIAVVLAGLAAGMLHHASITANTAEAVQREQARWLNQPPRNPHSATHFGQTAFHQPSLFSAFDSGVDPYVGVSVFLESHRRNFPRYPWAEEVGRSVGIGHFSAATALRILLPLFLILVAHAAIAAEREQGTLAFLMSLGVKPAHYVLGKFAGVFTGLLLIVFPVVVFGTTALALYETPVDAGEFWFRVAALVVLYGAYSCIFIGVALACSAWLRSATSARAAVLSFWILSTLVIPKVATEIAASLYPIPSAVELQRQIDDDPDRRGNPKDRQQLIASLMKQYNVTDPKDIPINYGALLAMRAEERGDKVIDRHYAQVQQASQDAVTWVSLASALSPTLAADGLSMAIAGSGPIEYERFLAQVELHRRMMVRKLNEANITFKQQDSKGEIAKSLWASIPIFHLQAPTLSWSLEQVRSIAIAFSAWLMVSLVLLVSAAWRVRRPLHS